MNTYKPVLLTTIDKNGNRDDIILREYSLHNLDISDMILSGRYAYVAVDNLREDWGLYDGFYIVLQNKRFIAYDFRVNEGISFSADTLDEIHLMIENCLYTLALEEQQERTKRAKQLEREKLKS